MFLKKIHLFLLIIKAFFKKEKKIIFLSAFGSVVIFLGIIKIVPYIPRPKSVERVGIVGNYTFEDLPRYVLDLASNGLTRINEEGKPLPSLAGKWEVEKEGKVYIFFLAENIFWQDGTEVLAKDIKYDLPQIETNVLDDKILQFNLKEPFAPLPALLSTPVFKEDFIGTGEYQIKKIKKSGSFIKTILLVGAEKNIIFSFYPTRKATELAFKLGEVDQLLRLKENPFDSQWQNYLKIERKLNKEQYLAIFLNLRDKNLANKNLRQALAYATPKPADQTRALGPLAPGSWAFNLDVKQYQADASQAKKLFNKFKEESNINDLELTIDTTNEFLKSAEEIKKSWQDILNIQTNIKLIDNISFDFQALLIVSQIPVDPDHYSFGIQPKKLI